MSLRPSRTQRSLHESSDLEPQEFHRRIDSTGVWEATNDFSPSWPASRLNRLRLDSPLSNFQKAGFGPMRS